MVVVKAWGATVAKINEKNGIKYFSLSPENKLNFSPIKLLEKGKTYDFSALSYQRGLPGLISDSLPGVYGKEYLDEFFMKHFKTVPTDLETLQFLGKNTMGALTYEPELEKIKNNRKELVLDAVELYDETKKALQGDADFAINEIIAMSNSAASGARPKAVVGFNPETKKMHVGLKYEEMPEGYIHSMVKFDNLIYKNSLKGISDKELASQSKAEYVYSLAAKKLGITMAKTHLVEAEGFYHFVTERFDIKKAKSSIQRMHMHSLSGLMHHNPAETTFDYENLFRVGEKLNIPYNDKVQLFKVMLFNLIYANKDDHSRNFSYLMDSDGNWRASPAYDLTYSNNSKHQMLFGLSSSHSVTLEHLVKLGDKYEIADTKETIAEMTELKHSYLKELSIEYDLKDWYKDVIKYSKNL
jgi:serine/threonine-protein kinase HipA